MNDLSLFKALKIQLIILMVRANEDSGTVAVIPARAGSVRISDKNLAALGGFSLIKRKVLQLKRVDTIDKVVVGTNSQRCAEEARSAGADIIWRDEYFCDETKASANEMLEDLAQKVEAETLMWVHCTNPFVSSNDYATAISTYFENLRLGVCDSLCSVTSVKNHMWNGSRTPANFDPKAPRHPLASELEAVYFQNGAFFIQSRRRFLETRYFYGDHPWLYDIDAYRALDINTEADLEAARAFAPLFDPSDPAFAHTP